MLSTGRRGRGFREDGRPKEQFRDRGDEGTDIVCFLTVREGLVDGHRKGVVREIPPVQTNGGLV